MIAVYLPGELSVNIISDDLIRNISYNDQKLIEKAGNYRT